MCPSISELLLVVEAPADWLAVAICRIAPAAQIPNGSDGRDAEPEQTGYLTAFFRRRRVATFPGDAA